VPIDTTRIVVSLTGGKFKPELIQQRQARRALVYEH
jgi:hypothetical protein